MSLPIKGGRITTAADDYTGDIYVEGGKVSPIGGDAEKRHTDIDYNLYEGTGAVRGQVIVENDELVSKPGAGRFVKRARFGEELR